jgi:ribosomal protein S18 acetylase RimI-like enzyme
MTDQLDPVVDVSVLDNPVWWSLTGPHAGFALPSGDEVSSDAVRSRAVRSGAVRSGAVLSRAVRYRGDVAVFGGLADENDPTAWADLSRINGPDERVVTVGVGPPPADWDVVADVPGVQFDGSALTGAPDAEAVPLGRSDVPEMLDLVRRTEPGPFADRTVELGTYLGIRRNGVLAAMAGERMHPPGWTEISAVCTDPAFRGQGLASRLVSAIVAGIRERGERPFLHTSATNTTAIRLYETLGFILRREMSFRVIRPVPGTSP